MTDYRLRVGVSLCGALFLMACGTSSSSEEETFALQAEQTAQHFTGKLSTLSAEERATYQSDWKYLISIAPRGRSVELNHADIRQHRFAATRLKIAGKTAANSPQLFALMDRARIDDMAKGLANGTVKTLVDDPGALENQHLIAATELATTDRVARSGTLGSLKDATLNVYLDVSQQDSDGNGISDLESIEIFGNMPYGVVQATGNLDWATTDKIVSTSFLSEALVGGGLRQFLIVAKDADIKDAAAITNVTVEHPSDPNNTGAITLCLQRLDGTCRYNNVGMWTLKVPLKGSVTIAGGGAIKVDVAKIKEYQANPVGRIFSTMGTHGGACQMPQTGRDVVSMAQFWKSVTLGGPDPLAPTVMSWDLYSNVNNWADFGANCQLVQDTVYITMDIEVPYVNILTGTQASLPVTISNAQFPRPLQAPNKQFQPALRVTNSCLAEGTMVAIPGSVPRKIEDIQIGDKVFAPYASSLTVTDIVKGIEHSPMVRITDSVGHQLLMTEMHPVYVVDRGMVQARFLKIGDDVKTTDGTTKLISVTREIYQGKVYNLKVGNAEEAHALGTDQTAVWANGFLVGDAQIQGRHEVMQMHAEAASPNRLPVGWRTDYTSSLGRGTQQHGQD